MPSQPGLPDGLEAVDLAAAPAAERMALSTEAGWNQTTADWHRLLRLGRGFGVAERGGPLVASAVILPYDSALAWISMVLVNARWRRRGLASILMDEALDACRRLGRTAFLDATPDGTEVYRQLGFAAGERITRWSRPAGAATTPLPTVRADASLEPACLLDARAMGAPRRALLEALAADGRPILQSGGSLLLRPGRVAWQIGPLTAADRRSADALLADGLAAVGAQAAFADARDAAGFDGVLRAAGFTPQRHFLRMHSGTPPPADPGLLWLTAGPEFG